MALILKGLSMVVPQFFASEDIQGSSNLINSKLSLLIELTLIKVLTLEGIILRVTTAACRDKRFLTLSDTALMLASGERLVRWR